ncbi:MAG: TldD/PmbA family protein [Candidatus Brockarchaeota archaeon]|nr:TldD/PmbA family protein [Candidatus Brockarchaeota archaeon]MBO3809319.1 TldD/PmbA family protein [Candidatus Brockarchaeota archaeon]
MDVEKAVKMAVELGASEAEAFLLSTAETSLTLAGDVEASKTVRLKSFGIRVAIGKSTAIVGTQDLSETGVGSAVRSAVSIARVSPPDPRWVRMNERIGTSDVGETFDKATAEATPEDLLPVARELLDSVKEGCREAKPIRGFLTSRAMEATYANTYGGPVTRRETMAFLYIDARVDEAGEVGTYSEYSTARSLRRLEAGKTGVEAGSRAKEFVKAGSIPNGKYEVVTLNRVSDSLLPVMLSPAVSALNVQEGRSPLAGKIGMEIMSEKITIEDFGSSVNTLGSKPFDDEGFPTRNLTIVGKGVLNTFVYDTYTANREGRESTGNASRGYSTAPRPSLHHLHLKPGEATFEEIISETRNGVLVMSTIGEWMSNPVSGHLNATITHAYMVENGEIARPVKNGVISGNFYEMLKDGLDMVGNDTRHDYGVSAPSLKFRNVVIASK